MQTSYAVWGLCRCALGVQALGCIGVYPVRAGAHRVVRQEVDMARWPVTLLHTVLSFTDSVFCSCPAESKVRMENLLGVMMRLRNARNLDSRQTNAIDSAYFACR